MPEKTHKLAAIVFTDIVGYTKRMEENEQRTMQLLQEQREIVFPLVESYGGEIIKEIGDGLLIMFDSAVQAVRFAINVQTRLKDEELTIRAGIHIGDVIFKGGDVFGSAVNTAARIEPLASPNGICISEDVRSQLHNKSDIITISCGKKELKGVKEPIEIFEIFIEGVSVKRAKSLNYVFKDLWRRNVIQIGAGYIASAWIIKQAVAAMISQYMLSPHLIQLTWILLLSLLPAVLILAYFHGKRSSSQWTKIELFGLPINLVLSIVMLFILFNGKDLGAATEKVTVETEDGKTITREIPKSEFRKDIVFFFMENESGNEQLDWLQYGLTMLFVYDISQDNFVEATNGLTLLSKFKDDGYPSGLGAPLMLKNKIAEFAHGDFFLTGSFTKDGEQWSVQIDVYDTYKGLKINTLNLSNTNLFALADEASPEIKRLVGIPTQQIQKAKDLSVEDIFTNSMEAFEEFTLSTMAIHLHNDYPKGVEHAEKSIEIDNEFVVAHMVLADYYFNSNLPEKSKEAIDITMDKLYRLPERNQFSAKFMYYILHQEPEQANAVLRMWADLYPYDIAARVTLAQRYLMNNEFDKAIAEYKYIISIIPDEYEYIRTLGDLYEQYGKYDSSLHYYTLYAKKYPNDPIAYKNLGDTYQKFSDFDKAMENYNKARLIEPHNSSTIIKIARIHMIIGEFDQAEQLLLSTLPHCKVAQDSLTMYTGLEGLSEMQGKMNESFAYYQEKFKLYAIISQPLRLMVLKTFMINKYIKVNKQDEALAILKEIEKELQPPLDKISAFGYLFYYTETREPEKAASYIDDAIELMHSFGEQNLIANVYYAEGRIAELNKDFPQAVEKYQNFLDLQPANADCYRWLARSYSENGDLDEALTNIDKALIMSPNNPKTLYEASRIYSRQKKMDKALEFIIKANDIWENADVNYEPAQKARAFRMEFSGA